MFNINYQNMGPFQGTDAMLAGLHNEGFAARRQKATEAYELAVNSAVRLFSDVLSGDEAPWMLQEAIAPRHASVVEELNLRYPGMIHARETMSVSDFSQYLTVDVLDRVLWGYYQTSVVPNFALVKKVTLNDTRNVKRFTVNGGIAPFERQMNPGEPPKQRALTPVAPIEYSPDVYQGMMSINWRALLNDDMGIFREMTQGLNTSWNLTVWEAITNLFVDTAGPNALLYNSTFKNQILITNGSTIDNPPLDFQGLADGRAVLERMRTPDDQPITHQGQLYLVVGTALQQTAEFLLGSDKADVTVLGGTANADGFPVARLTVNPKTITQGIKLIVDKKMRDVCTTSGVRDTMWMLTYDPNAQARPSIEFGMVRGWDQPILLQKAPNTMRVGGGVDPMLGDFLTGDLDYKSVVIYGGAQGDGRSTVASTGQGTRVV